jgi:hypothetical protein
MEERRLPEIAAGEQGGAVAGGARGPRGGGAWRPASLGSAAAVARSPAGKQVARERGRERGRDHAIGGMVTGGHRQSCLPAFPGCRRRKRFHEFSYSVGNEFLALFLFLPIHDDLHNLLEMLAISVRDLSSVNRGHQAV